MVYPIRLSGIFSYPAWLRNKGVRIIEVLLYCDSNGNLSTSAVHVHDVVTDCSYALAEFLVSTLFGAFPGQS